MLTVMSNTILLSFFFVFSFWSSIYSSRIISNNYNRFLDIFSLLKQSSEATCRAEARCGPVFESKGIKLNYLGCNKNCSALSTNDIIKNCYRGYCSNCSKINEQCDPDNPRSCCKYQLTEKIANNIFVKQTSCPSNGICPAPEPCFGGSAIGINYPCDPKQEIKCCAPNKCFLSEPPNTFRCQAQAPIGSTCTKDMEGKGGFTCINYENVVGLETGFCKCPDKIDGTDVGQCKNKRCTKCINYQEKCALDGPSCCNFYRNQGSERSGCINGICDVCHASNVDFYLDEICKGGPPCCNRRAKCQRSGKSDYSICVV